MMSQGVVGLFEVKNIFPTHQVDGNDRKFEELKNDKPKAACHSLTWEDEWLAFQIFTNARYLKFESQGLVREKYVSPRALLALIHRVICNKCSHDKASPNSLAKGAENKETCKS